MVPTIHRLLPIYKKRPNLFKFCLFSFALLLFYPCTQSLISFKDISCIYFFFYIVQTTIISVGDNCLALFLKFFQIIDYFASEECCTIFQRWLVDNYRYIIDEYSKLENQELKEDFMCKWIDCLTLAESKGDEYKEVYAQNMMRVCQDIIREEYEVLNPVWRNYFSLCVKYKCGLETK